MKKEQELKDEIMWQDRTCKICGQKGYPLSCGGEDICPACDCGHNIIIGDYLYKRVKRVNLYR
jgi:hypothetical protein